MNIMFLFYKPIIPNAGGVQRVTYVLTKELLNRGHNVVFVSCTDNRDFIDQKFIVPQYHLELDRRDEQEIGKEIQTLLKQHRITHAICQTLDKAYLFKYFPSNIKKVAVCHVQPFSFMGISRKRIWNTNAQNIRQLLFKTLSLIYPKIKEKFFLKFETRALEEANEYADKICFISERFFSRIKRYLPSLPQDKFVAINNPNTYDVADIKLVPNKDNIILWVGRVENAQKNAIDFVRMWYILSKKAKDWRAIMVGDGSDLAYIINYVKSNHIERIEFVGKRNDTEEFYKRAKYIAVTSFGESWCLVLTEAMSYGCVPVVYDTYETLHDIVDDKLNGYIIPTVSHIEMAKCLYDSINEENFIKLSTAAHEKVKKFSLGKTVNSWENLLNNLS